MFEHDLMPMRRMMTADHTAEPAEVERGRRYDTSAQPRPYGPEKPCSVTTCGAASTGPD
ncbi:hypothetical protein [Streptomyces sp. NPDC020742]|uniref:hypothetical protein n=1 Tax=Streptomyces sp. NPDC020742 TaxID=3154897 RepID=UPI0033F39BD5